MFENESEAELNTHLLPFVAVGLISAAVGAWQVSVGGTSLPPWSAYYAILGLLLFGSSSLYHLAKGSPREAGMNKLDHIGIHAMIAGTGTMHMAILPSIQRGRVPTMVGIVWGLALVGVLYRVFRGSRVNEKAVMVVYGLMAMTTLPAIAFGEHFWDWSMCFTYIALAVYAFSVKVFFGEGKSHAWWHVGVVVGYLLAGVPVFL